jgi:uncharacterized protein YuzE
MRFRRPQNATKTIEVSEDVLIRKNGRTIVGVTMMNAGKRQIEKRVRPNAEQ